VNKRSSMMMSNIVPADWNYERKLANGHDLNTNVTVIMQYWTNKIDNGTQAKTIKIKLPILVEKLPPRRNGLPVGKECKMKKILPNLWPMYEVSLSSKD